MPLLVTPMAEEPWVPWGSPGVGLSATLPSQERVSGACIAPTQQGSTRMSFDSSWLPQQPKPAGMLLCWCLRGHWTPPNGPGSGLETGKGAQHNLLRHQMGKGSILRGLFLSFQWRRPSHGMKCAPRRERRKYSSIPS